MFKSCVVYQYFYARDSRHLLHRKSKRHFLTRMKEHQKQASAIKTHSERCPYFAFSNVKTPQTCTRVYQASIIEAILLRNNRPCLNKCIKKFGTNYFLKTFCPLLSLDIINYLIVSA